MLLARWNVQKISVRISVDALKLCLYFIFIILLIELGMTGCKTFRALSLSVFSLIWMYHVLGETLKFSFLLCISSLLQKRCHQFGSYICIQIALLFSSSEADDINIPLDTTLHDRDSCGDYGATRLWFRSYDGNEMFEALMMQLSHCKENSKQ